jgi:anti-sigma factor RsiW
VSGHPGPLLSAYADGELREAERAEIEAHIARCTECARELALIRSMGGMMREIRSATSGPSVWRAVDRKINRPVGWILVILGTLLWAGLALVAWFRQALTWEWAAITAIGVGLLMIGVGVGLEQYREWKRSPYKELEQ